MRAAPQCQTEFVTVACGQRISFRPQCVAERQIAVLYYGLGKDDKIQIK